jgi:hypothetical protein
MLDHVNLQFGPRKLRLYSCACCRRIWHLNLTPAGRQAVEVAERFVDGLAGEEELATAHQAIEAVVHALTNTQMVDWWTACAAASPRHPFDQGSPTPGASGSEREQAMRSRVMGQGAFVDGVTRPIFEDERGQYIKEDGERIDGVRLRPEGDGADVPLIVGAGGQGRPRPGA